MLIIFHLLNKLRIKSKSLVWMNAVALEITRFGVDIVYFHSQFHIMSLLSINLSVMEIMKIESEGNQSL